MSQLFLSQTPQLEDYWRAIILFGRNVASYKFALAKSLLELRPESGQLIKLEELARPFSQHVSLHLKHADKQATSATSRFLDACRRFNDGKTTQEDLVEQTVRLGFNNVIDAFHCVGADQIDPRFFVDRRTDRNGIEITDQFSVLARTEHIQSLSGEVEARWRLVETAWELGLSANVLDIEYDKQTEGLLALSGGQRRTAVTGCRDALNGYQKGACFYCFRTISLTEQEKSPDVDHFFPHVLKGHEFGRDVDGVWNLVLACRECNRGSNGKFMKVPTVELLERLYRRNNFLISSHHPLRETLIRQIGSSPVDQRKFLQACHNDAKQALIHEWEAAELREPMF